MKIRKHDWSSLAYSCHSEAVLSATFPEVYAKKESRHDVRIRLRSINPIAVLREKCVCVQTPTL